MTNSRCTVLLLLAMARLAGAQPASPAIQLLSSHQISAANATHPHVESFIAVDPGDPRHLLATAIVIVKGEVRSYPYASFDGGTSWARGRMVGDTSVVLGGDPVVYITRSGSSFFSTLPVVKGVSRSAVSRSTDGGRSWSSTTLLPDADRQWLAFDQSRGAFGGRTYFTGTGVYPSRDGKRAVAPFLARSDDDGRSFPFRSIVGYDRSGADPQAPLNAVPLEPLVTPGGLLVLPLQRGDAQTIERLARDSLSARSPGLVTSDDGGDSFGEARFAPTYLTTVTGSPGRRFRAVAASGYIRTALDVSSGRYRNRVYFASSSYDPTIDRYVVRVWHTSDFGKTWGDAVASDAPRGDIANPAIAVNREGVVAVSWNDRRDDPSARCWQLYAAISTDGGEHFLPAQRLSRARTCTNEPRNWDTFGTSLNSDQSGQYLAHFQTGATIPARFPNGGDTQGLVADATGLFHAAWINGETGVMQLWHTSFRVDAAQVARGPSVPIAATDSSIVSALVPKGMEDVTHDIRFRVSSTTLDFTARSYAVTLQIENQSGRPLRGPLRAVMLHFLDSFDNGLGLRNLAVANADSGGPGVGAVWTFPVPGGVLVPGALSAARVVRFTFDGAIPEVPEGYLTPGFRVYAPVALSP
ncbi:MAG: glycoside hydrolase [Gemmatimonadota bacterium]|nr:glycoside hydrolase [Gemmatimonadota bacterium]